MAQASKSLPLNRSIHCSLSALLLLAQAVPLSRDTKARANGVRNNDAGILMFLIVGVSFTGVIFFMSKSDSKYTPHLRPRGSTIAKPVLALAVQSVIHRPRWMVAIGVADNLRRYPSNGGTWGHRFKNNAAGPHFSAVADFYIA